MESLLTDVMPAEDAGSFNQGLMEIGETLCIPKGRPRCAKCPMRFLCLASLKDQTDQIPVKTPPKKRKIQARTVCLLQYNGRVGLRKREDNGLLASLYELPNVEGHLMPEQLSEAFCFDENAISAWERLPDARHVFSHVEWHMIGYRIILTKAIPENYIAAQKEEVKTIYPLPNAFGRYIKCIK